MWILENNTPFAGERTWVRDRNGAEVWVVVVKGTFSVNSNGSTQPAEKQMEVCRVPEYFGEPGKSSLRYDLDLVDSKPTTDVILHGHAYAPKEKKTAQIDATMKVGQITKTLRVFGDRYWRRGLLGLKMTRSAPFVKMPIIYERAFGGVDQKSTNSKKPWWEPRNPVGKGFAVKSKHLVGEQLPNVEVPKALISSWKHRPRPAGFGPIARDWSSRIQLAGTYDEKWERERLPLLPDDFDERFYLCAPDDQRAQAYLRGGESVELQNLTPEGLLRFRLPRVALGFETRFFTRETISHRAVLHTVTLEPDVPRIIMVWHTRLPCHSKALKLQRTTITQKKLL
jgi:hypothetical protein